MRVSFVFGGNFPAYSNCFVVACQGLQGEVCVRLCVFALLTMCWFTWNENRSWAKTAGGPWALSSFGFFSQGLHAVLSRGRGARKGDGRICEWCLCAWRLSLADVKEEVSGVRRKAIYGKELWNFSGFPSVYLELLSSPSLPSLPSPLSELKAILLSPFSWDLEYEIKSENHLPFIDGKKKCFLEIS